MAKGIAQLETEAQFTICNLNPTDPKVNYVLSMNLDLLLEMGMITISEEKVVTLTSLGEHIAELFEPTSLVVEAQKRLVDSVSQTTATSNP